ncbi:hypothetical protein PanWU01x14_010850 [Parasponia andersonii]|uniref:Uncharacterized protein n=1 Tax=Parasponia andersonii TaxID=3476 RepID=A0A2P5E2U7_PARAD|nr:hypothetical protein PanWU01x14_010850 [Parasponia andersonii]
MDHLARQPVVTCFSVGINIQKWIGNWSIYNPGDEQIELVIVWWPWAMAEIWRQVKIIGYV